MKLSEMLGKASSSPAPMGEEDDFSPEEDGESEKHAAFMEMAKAISEGDFEAAWAAWKDYC